MYVGVVVGRLTGYERPTGSLAMSSVTGCASGSCGLMVAIPPCQGWILAALTRMLKKITQVMR